MSFFSRREFLRLSTLAAGALISRNTALAAAAEQFASERGISFYNIHTEEELETVYWAKGQYLPDALAEINHLLRDFRTEEIKPIDPRLLDTLHSVSRNLGAKQPFHVLSGYRSPETNSLLRKTSSGVAVRSLHLVGKAIDIRLPGCELRSLWRAALELRAGGVGYYRSSDFIHLDTGRVRRWRS